MDSNTNVNNNGTRQKQSDATKRRNRQYNKTLDDLDDKRATMDDLLSAHPNMEEYIKTLVRQQIDEMIRRELNQSINS